VMTTGSTLADERDARAAHIAARGERTANVGAPRRPRQSRLWRSRADAYERREHGKRCGPRDARGDLACLVESALALPRRGQWQRDDPLRAKARVAVREPRAHGGGKRCPRPVDERNVAAVLDPLNQAVDGERIGERRDRFGKRRRRAHAFTAVRAMFGRKRAYGTSACDQREVGGAVIAKQRTAARAGAERAVLRQSALQKLRDPPDAVTDSTTRGTRSARMCRPGAVKWFDGCI